MPSKALFLGLIVCFFLSLSSLKAEDLREDLSRLRATNENLASYHVKRIVYLPVAGFLYVLAASTPDIGSCGALIAAGAVLAGGELWHWYNPEGQQLRFYRRKFERNAVYSLFEFEAELLEDLELLFLELGIPFKEGETLAEFAEKMKAFNAERAALTEAPQDAESPPPAEKKALWEQVLFLKNRCTTWREAEKLTRARKKMRGNLDVESVELLGQELNKLGIALWSPLHFRNGS